MIKSQVQIPDELYWETTRMADDYEMSFAEIVRRSLEWTLSAYPPRDSGWRLPAPLSRIHAVDYLGSARASRAGRGALASTPARHDSLNGGDSTHPTRTARAPSGERGGAGAPLPSAWIRLSLGMRDPIGDDEWRRFASPPIKASQMMAINTNRMFAWLKRDHGWHATANVKDFQDFGFTQVWNPLDPD